MDDECAICLKPCNLVLVKCKHCVCSPCLNQWINQMPGVTNHCPVCRQTVETYSVLGSQCVVGKPFIDPSRFKSCFEYVAMMGLLNNMAVSDPRFQTVRLQLLNYGELLSKCLATGARRILVKRMEQAAFLRIITARTFEEMGELKRIRIMINEDKEVKEGELKIIFMG